jgi:hypothetical protein
LRRNLVNRNPGLREKHAGVFDVIDAGWLNVYRLESSISELRPIVRLLQCSGNAAHPKQHAFANGIRHLATQYNVRDGEATARTEDAKSFLEHPGFICGEVDYAIRDDDID